MVRTLIPQPEEEEAQILLAKRMFIGGCFFLPWLWFVNVCYFWTKVYGPITGGGGGPSGVGGGNAGRTELAKWVSRSLIGAIAGITLFFAWVVLIQLKWRTWGKSIAPFMITMPDRDATGW